MERSPAVRKTVPAFVNWEEVFSTNPRGRKEVRYYLKRRDGTSDLVVVGKEKKLGHHKTTTTSFRYRYANRDLFPSLNLPFEIPSKLRSRREVIDWLSSLVTEFQWVGSSWTCMKKRKHYEAYSRRGVRISVHDFVYVLAEQNKRLIAYVNDLYEDSRKQKLAILQWFHKFNELDLDLDLNSHHKYNRNENEIFFSINLQDLSIECIDGLATVLTPQHYKKFLKSDKSPTILEHPFVCHYQIDNGKVKPFDLTKVNGYWNQNKCGFVFKDDVSVRPRKRLRRLVDGEYGGVWKHGYEIGSEIEVLSQDSGIRGTWFKGVVIKKYNDKIKVRYCDIKDAADESVNLEEWILATKVASDDPFGIRDHGRTTVRPSRPPNKTENVTLVDIGSIVDAWLHDGWWEGIVVQKESDGRIHVYFPEEKQRSVFESKDLRYSEEWLDFRWKKMKNRPDLLGSVSSNDTGSGLTETIHEKEVDFDRSEDDIRTRLNWNWSTKKRRCYPSNINKLEHWKQESMVVL